MKYAEMMPVYDAWLANSAILQTASSLIDSGEEFDVSETNSSSLKKGFVISSSNLGFSYKANQPVISDIDFAIEQGDFVVIHGPSGSGKSTLLRLISGLSEPTEGVLKFDGVEYSDSIRLTIRRKFSHRHTRK